MAFDFDEVVPRRGSGSSKWDAESVGDSLPMWVADMDFRTAPVVRDALADRVAHGIFGYTEVGAAYFDAVAGWFHRRHQVSHDTGAMLVTSGVVPALTASLRAVTRPGDAVIVQTPVYNCFFSSIRNMGCRIVSSPLRLTDGRAEMDFDDLDRRAADPDVRALLLCNPHNPLGRVWTEAELATLAGICRRHGVTVISDEIHCDLVHPDQRHHAFARVDPGAVTLVSPSKAFNIAGLQIATIIAPDAALRGRIDKALNVHEVCDVNPFGVTATLAAYGEGAPWLDALNRYLAGNRALLSVALNEACPALRLTPSEATYLAWIDARTLGESAGALTERLQREVGLKLSPGTLYGAAGEGFLRLNYACPRSTLRDGIDRLIRGIG